MDGWLDNAGLVYGLTTSHGCLLDQQQRCWCEDAVSVDQEEQCTCSDNADLSSVRRSSILHSVDTRLRLRFCPIVIFFRMLSSLATGIMTLPYTWKYHRPADLPLEANWSSTDKFGASSILPKSTWD